MKNLYKSASALLAGLAGAALFFWVALLMHWGGLGQPAQVATSATSSGPAPQLTAAAAPATGAMSPAQIYQKYGNSVVQIVSTFSGSDSGPNDIFHQGQQPEQGIGSGFVASPDGYILTNAHVVTNATSMTGGPTSKASDVEVNFPNGKKAKAQIVGYDLTSSDIAVLKVDPSGLDLVPAVLGDSDKVQVGEPVVAIGSPFGIYASSLTAGVVSAVNRTVESPEAGFTINNAIQTDAAINKGNSGGPLFNSNGEVIGLNEQIASSTGGSEGVGFAVPIDTAKKVMDQIINNGQVQYAFMGITGQTVDESVAQHKNLQVQKGALITSVQNGSPAEQAGLKANDVIVAIDDKAMTSMEDVTGYLLDKKPGDTIKVTYQRGGDKSDTNLQLGTRPQQ